MKSFETESVNHAIAIRDFNNHMLTALEQAAARGKSGWMDRDKISGKFLSDRLRRAVEKGDPVHVANYAMMLHHRREKISPATASTKLDDFALKTASNPATGDPARSFVPFNELHRFNCTGMIMKPSPSGEYMLYSEVKKLVVAADEIHDRLQDTVTALKDQVADLEKYKAELLRLAAAVGEEGDPFAAWEHIEPLIMEKDLRVARQPKPGQFLYHTDKNGITRQINPEISVTANPEHETPTCDKSHGTVSPHDGTTYLLTDELLDAIRYVDQKINSDGGFRSLFPTSGDLRDMHVALNNAAR